MKKVIRRSIFETNSSSVHSISVSNTAKLSEYPEGNEDTIIITPGEYGWDGDDVAGFVEKVRYLMTMILDYEYEWNEENHTLIPDNMKLDLLKSDVNWQKICGVVREHKHKELVPYIPEGCRFYVDHQSCMSLNAFLGKMSLEEFLFNPAVVVEIDNDN